MKKAYINPETKIVRIKASTQMLSGSTMNIQGDYDKNKITISSRRGRNDSFWDDEE